MFHPSMSRRHFLRALPLSALVFSRCKPDSPGVQAMQLDELSDQSAVVEGSRSGEFLKEMGKSFRGQTIRILTEDTPPSAAARRLVQDEFSELTGIQIEWIAEPLDQVYARTSIDTAQHSGHHDIFYIDYTWLARFSSDLEPLQVWMERDDLKYPDWDFQDFMEPLRRHLGMVNNELVAVPYDIPIFMGAYRRDVLESLGIEPPANLEAWKNVCKAVTDEMAPKIYGMTAQWKVGHMSVYINMTAWLWGNGGSLFNADGSPAIADEAGLAGLNYMKDLSPYVAPGATTWDWNGEWKCFARGEAALFGAGAEFFPYFDDPNLSKIVGLAEPLPMPAPYRLRPASQCGYGETPGSVRQGGSGIGISRASRKKEAAWIFLQWLTCKDINVRSTLLGGSSSAVRLSTFDDPRITSRSKLVGPGTTRHLAIVKDSIINNLGNDPSHPNWSEISRDYFTVELGKMVTDQQSVIETARALEKAADRINHI